MIRINRPGAQHLLLITHIHMKFQSSPPPPQAQTLHISIHLFHIKVIIFKMAAVLLHRSRHKPLLTPATQILRTWEPLRDTKAT
jgi:hypothetical protein